MAKFPRRFGIGSGITRAQAKKAKPVPKGTPTLSQVSPSYFQTPPKHGIPLDPAAEAQKIAAGRNLAVGNIGATLNQEYLGYDTGYSPTGARDYSNPYSRAALLQESYNRSRRGTTNSYAAAGQLYSGAYGRMQDENARNYLIGSNQLQTAAQRGYTGIGLGKLTNAANYGTSLSTADFNALIAALGLGG